MGVRVREAWGLESSRDSVEVTLKKVTSHGSYDSDAL